MTSKPTALEQFAEEFNRVDQELKLLQKDLEDTLQLNDNFQKSIEQKGEELAAKDEYLMTLREKNAAEIEQLLLEEASSKEHFEHEINFHTVELHNLRIKKQRLEELREENRRLQTSLEYLENQTNKDRLQHALAMHDMNKEMKLLRQQMEQKLRKELAGLELSFQEEAFSALQDKQKKAMLENAKLKDEVALQGVGIANLTSRLIKQQLAYDKCKKVLTKYEKKSHVLRERLADATMFKNNLLKLRENYLKEEYDLLQEKEKLTQQLHINSISSASATATATATATANNSANPSITNHESAHSPASTLHRKSPRKQGAGRYAQTMMVVNDLITRYLTAKDTYRDLLTKQKVWINRYDSMKNIFLDLRAMNDNEENGNYQKKYFPLQELIQEIIAYIQQQQIIDPAIMLRKLPVSSAIAAATTSHSSSLNPKFSKFDRPLTPAVQSENSSVTGGAISTTSTTQGSEVLFEIQKIIKQDADLSEALKHLKGKESSILTAFQENKNDEAEGDQKEEASGMSKRDEDKDQNMIAWTVLKIINLWFGVEEKVERGVFTIDEESDGELGGNEEDMSNEDFLGENKNNSIENCDIIWPPLHEETNLTNEASVDDALQTSSVEKSSISTNSQLQEPDYYEKHQQHPHATFQLSEEEIQREEENMKLQRQRSSLEAMDEWEAKMLSDIQQVREEENAKKLISDKKLQETGIGYYDQPPESSTWLYKVPPRQSKLFVFTNEIKEKLVPKTSSLSVRATTAYRREALKLADVGPPIIIHEFLSPLARPSSASLPSPHTATISGHAKSSDLQDMTLQSNTLTSLNNKPRPQRKESQILHYDSERDPLLFNQKKKNLTLPKSPPRMAMTTESAEPHSIYKKEFISDRTLPRKLQIALSKTASVPLLLPNSKPNTPGLQPLTTVKTSKDPLLTKKKNHEGRKGLSYSTGALLSLK